MNLDGLSPCFILLFLQSCLPFFDYIEASNGLFEAPLEVRTAIKAFFGS